MTLDEIDAVDAVSTRLGQVAATARLCAGAADFDPWVSDALVGCEEQLRDLAARLDAVTELHTPKPVAKGTADASA